MDVFEPGPGAQLHDLNASSFPPTGLFWTIEIPGNGIQVNLRKGIASMEADDVPILDYGNIPNALFLGDDPTPTSGSVSFKVAWRGVNERLNIQNTDPVFGGLWAHSSTGDFTFDYAPLRTSSSVFAEIGHERNGVFFP